MSTEHKTDHNKVEHKTEHPNHRADAKSEANVKPKTMAEWQKKVEEHCPPGTVIPDWLQAEMPVEAKK